MKCEEARHLLDQLENGGDPPAALSSHWTVCDDCRDDRRRFEERLNALRDLPPRRPQRDLWPEIAERLDRPTTRDRDAFPWRAAAAVLLTTGLIGWLAVRDQTEFRSPEPEQIQVVSWHDLLAASAEQAAENLAVRRDDLPQESAAALAENLRRLEGAIAEIEQAIVAHPGNRELELLLASRVRQQARLIQRISLV